MYKYNSKDVLNMFRGGSLIYNAEQEVCLRLFSGNTPGFWYDPNDLTAEKLKWRRNLFTETEFRNGLTDAPVRSGDITAVSFLGLNSNTGIRINRQVGTHSYAYKTFTQTVGVLYSFSAYVRMLDGSAPVIGGTSALATDDFAVVLGGRVANLPNRTLTDLGGGLYKITAVTPDTFLSSSFGFIKYETNSNKGFVVSGYQLEVGTVTTPYQPFTNFNSEFMAAFPDHTLYQDALGTTPVTSSGQPVGLILDKSKGLIATEIVVNKGNPFTTTTGWQTIGGTVTLDTGSIVVTNTAAAEASALQSGSVVSGRWYEINVTVTQASNGGVIIVGGTRMALGGVGNQRRFVSAGNNTNLAIGTNSAVLGHTLKVSSISVKEIAGNHAFQTTSASRPILRQTPILGSETVLNGDFNNGMSNWIAAGNSDVSITNGEIKVLNTSGGLTEQATQSIFSRITKGATYAYSVTLRETNNASRILIETPVASLINVSMSTAKTYTGMFTVPTDAADLSVRLRASTSVGSYGIFDSVTIKEITGYNTVQNFLEFDGIDDFLVTNNIDFTATDKVSLFTGVRKFSDITRGILIHSGTSTPAPNALGNFSIEAPSFQLSGYSVTIPSSGGNWDALVTTPSPHSAVLSARLWQSGSTKNEALRFNVNAVLSPVFGGTTPLVGNFGNLPIYIGRRGGAALPFGGNLYSLIGVGNAVGDADTILLEKLIALKTGVTLSA